MREHRVIATLEEMMANANTDSGRLRAAELLGKTIGLYRNTPDVRDEKHVSVAELEARLERILASSRSGVGA